MRIKSLVVLSLVCSLSQAADTVASLGDSIKATQFVTAVDHTRLVNGTTEVIANADGTASISTAQSVQKPNCVRVSQADGSTGKTIVLSFRQTSDELESWGSSWPDQLEFTIEYDGVSYDAITVGELDSDGREVSTSLSWMNGSRIFPAGIYSSTGWSGALYDFESPGGLDLIGDGNGESCSTYTYTSSIGTSSLIVTTDQLSEFVDKSVTNGLASTSWVNSHKWDWGTQVTNSPFTLHTTGFPYVEVPIGFAATDSGVGYAVPSSASFAGAKVHGVESLGVGDGIITNCYGGIGLGMAFNVTNDVAFVWSGRDYNGAKYGSHGMSTFNVDPHDGPAGFWIGETNLATYLENAGGPYEHEHDHLTSLNNEWKLVQLNGGKAVIMPAYYSGSQGGIEAKFSPAVPMEEVWYMQTNALLTAPASADFYMNGQHAAHCDGYVTGGTQFNITNKVIKVSGFNIQDSLPISYPSSATAPGSAFNQSPPSSFTFAGQIDIPITPMQTLVSAEYIASKLEGVNVNLQSAEDTRVALTNLITILKNL